MRALSPSVARRRTSRRSARNADVEPGSRGARRFAQPRHRPDRTAPRDKVAPRSRPFANGPNVRETASKPISTSVDDSCLTTSVSMLSAGLRHHLIMATPPDAPKFARRILVSVFATGAIVLTPAPALAGRPTIFDLQNYLRSLTQDNRAQDLTRRPRAAGEEPVQPTTSTAPKYRK